jgi:hypothetical protein
MNSTLTPKRKLDFSKATTIVAALQELTKQREIEHARLAHGLDLMLKGEAYYSHVAESWICASASNPNKIYAVDLQLEMCSCQDHIQRGVYCKHLIAAWLQWRVLDILDKAYQFRQTPENLEWLNPVPA